jgi:septum site-determining protein MinD
MGKTIILCSAKGGTGKTTTAINLGVALAQRGKKVAVVDGSLTTPDISLHLAVPHYIKTLNDVVEKKATIEEATFTHKSGLKIISSSVHIDQSLKWLSDPILKNILNELKKENDYVLVDSAAGLDFTAIGVIKTADELLVIVNPEISAVINSYKSVLAGKKHGIKATGMIINKHKKFKNELGEDEIFSVMGRNIPLLGKIPEDTAIQMSQRKSETLMDFAPNSNASNEFQKIAAIIAGEKFKEQESILEKIFSFFKH